MDPAESAAGASTNLTTREVSILRQLMGDYSHKATARELKVSEAIAKVPEGAAAKGPHRQPPRAAVRAMDNRLAEQAT